MNIIRSDGFFPILRRLGNVYNWSSGRSEQQSKAVCVIIEPRHFYLYICKGFIKGNKKQEFLLLTGTGYTSRRVGRYVITGSC